MLFYTKKNNSCSFPFKIRQNLVFSQMSYPYILDLIGYALGRVDLQALWDLQITTIAEGY